MTRAIRRRRTNRAARALRLAAASVSLALVAPPAPAAEKSRPVVLTGHAVPGNLPSVKFGDQGRPYINNAGQIIFYSHLTGAAAAQDTGLFLATFPGATGAPIVSRLLQEGMPAPGLPAGHTVGDFLPVDDFFPPPYQVTDGGTLAALVSVMNGTNRTQVPYVG